MLQYMQFLSAMTMSHFHSTYLLTFLFPNWVLAPRYAGARFTTACDDSFGLQSYLILSCHNRWLQAGFQVPGKKKKIKMKIFSSRLKGPQKSQEVVGQEAGDQCGLKSTLSCALQVGGHLYLLCTQGLTSIGESNLKPRN